MNPTRAPATVEYRLPSAANVSLEVYDAAGRRVRVIDRGARAAGDHRTTWDGRAENGAPATSGVYFVRLAVENGTKGLKLALLR
jgi:flagellar hook assembly protein FlgD